MSDFERAKRQIEEARQKFEMNSRTKEVTDNNEAKIKAENEAAQERNFEIIKPVIPQILQRINEKVFNGEGKTIDWHPTIVISKWEHEIYFGMHDGADVYDTDYWLAQKEGRLRTEISFPDASGNSTHIFAVDATDTVCYSRAHFKPGGDVEKIDISRTNWTAPQGVKKQFFYYDGCHDCEIKLLGDPNEIADQLQKTFLSIILRKF